MPLYLPILFFATSLLYASAGFGGGSTYNALLALSGVHYRLFPILALTCNIIVSAGGVLHYSRNKYLNIRKLSPFLYTSLPAAWIGASIHVSEIAFTGLLALSLLLAGTRLLLAENKPPLQHHKNIQQNTLANYAAGSILGMLAGMIGIGGGIFLAPLLYFQRWGTPQQIAAACSLFILLNSIAGLAGQTGKLLATEYMPEIFGYWLLFPAVLAGGQIGSRLGSKVLAATTLKRITALLILYASARLILRWARMAGWV